MDLSPKDLRQVVIFENATEEDLAQVAQAGFFRSVEEGGFFFFQGDPATYLYILTQGQVKLLQSNRTGQQVNLRTLYPWQLFGALGAVRGPEATYPASAQALEDSTALTLPSSFVKEMLQTRPYLSLDLMKLMTSYIQEMQTRYRELATERVEQRIARSLLRLTAQSGQKVDEAIELAFSRQDLAEMSGTTLYTVSRVLSDWERRGLIEASRELVRIKDPHGLVRVAEDMEN